MKLVMQLLFSGIGLSLVGLSIAQAYLVWQNHMRYWELLVGMWFQALLAAFGVVLVILVWL